MGCGASVVSADRAVVLEEAPVAKPERQNEVSPTRTLLKGLNGGAEDISIGEAFVNIQDFVLSYSNFIKAIYDSFAGKEGEGMGSSNRLTYDQYMKVFQVLQVEMDEDGLVLTFNQI